MLNFSNVTFNDSVTIKNDAQACFDKCVFNAQGSGIKDSSKPSLNVSDSAKVKVSNSTFKGKGYSAIFVRTSAKMEIENNTFECANYYNPIEGTVSTGSAVRDVVISGNTFNGKCGNNYINFYKMDDDAVISISDNVISGMSKDSEAIRISNPSNVSATFNVENFNYIFEDAGVAGDYTSFIMCQDYTNKNGNPQDFSLVTINLKNVMNDGTPVSADYVKEGKLSFTYVDGQGIVENNNPVINFN